MSENTFSQKKIALLACSGFDEKSFVSLQQSLIALGASVKVISRDSGLVNGWVNNGWGLSYPVDAVLAETLAIDYDMFVVPTGERHSTMMMNEAHGRRIINAFLREQVPGILMGTSIQAAAEQDMLAGYNYGEDAVSVDKNLVLASEDADTKDMVDALVNVVANTVDAAAA